MTRNFGCDSGIAAQSVMLGAVERGLGGCMIASIKKESLRTVLNISDQYEILLVLALGRPRESVTIESLKSGATSGTGEMKTEAITCPNGRSTT